MSKKKILYMTKGLPASGKSTWAREKVDEYAPGVVVRVNKDDLRAMLHNGHWSGNRTERQIVAARNALIRNALQDDRVQVVISDDTNFEPVHEATLRKLAEDHGAVFIIRDEFLEVSKEECIKRDLKRANSVGHKVINKMYLKHLAKPFEPPAVDYNLPNAIIVDIDGTLAHMNGRSPYDGTLVHTDTVDKVVKGLVLDAVDRGLHILVVSGRKDDCYHLTLQWLAANDIPFDDLWMRKSDDNRDDGIVKREIYEEHIAGKFNVRYVLDDRDRVVDMWRSLGLKCLQVAPGDF
jgi:predicted kinase